jgi:hypothetical protein
VFKTRYQETANEGVEDFVCAAVTAMFRVCKPVRLLQLLVVTIYKWSINQSLIQTPSVVTLPRANTMQLSYAFV